MDKDQKFWLVFWTIFAIFTAVIIIGTSKIYTDYVVDMGKAGFCETQKIGGSDLYWQKCKGNN
jgi:hypothetical protein